MEKEIISLSVEIKKTKGKAEQFQFNETMVHAILSGLSVVYDEVIILSCQNRLGVWVVGGSTDFLIQAFLHHRNHFKKIQILDEKHSLQLFNNIASGNEWQEISAVARLESLHKAHALANELNALGSRLRPMFLEGLTILSENPSIIGSRNSWGNASPASMSEVAKASGIVKITLPDLFYRFSIN